MTKQKKVSTLEGFQKNGFIPGSGHHGNTTRLADKAIQIIFSGNICIVEDSYSWGKDEKANRKLFDIIIRRLENEHSISIRTPINIDRNLMEIFLSKTPIREKGRATGRTTRLADEYIQKLFNHEEIKIIDHEGHSQNERNVNLFRFIIHRLGVEHNLVYLRRKGLIQIDSNKHIIHYK